MKEIRDNDEEHYDDSVPVAIFTEYEEAPIVPSQFGAECPQKTEDRIRLARFFWSWKIGHRSPWLNWKTFYIRR